MRYLGIYKFVATTWDLATGARSPGRLRPDPIPTLAKFTLSISLKYDCDETNFTLDEHL